MTRLAPLLVVAALVAVAGSAAAHGFYRSDGVATRDGEAYDVRVTRWPDNDLADPNNVTVTIRDRDTGDVVVEDRFLVDDNFDDPVTPFVTPYHAESATDGVTFRLDGTATFEEVTATGVYEDWNLTVAPQVPV